MDGDLSVVLLRGGPVALVVAFGYALKWAIESWLQWRRERDEDVEKVSPIADAATTNALLLDALRDERTELRRRGERIDELEAEVEQLRDAIFTQRRQYEREIGDLRSKVQDVTLQLEALQARLAASLPDSLKEGHNG